MDNEIESAFPHSFTSGEGQWQSAGLTKRELFAAMAMQGFCAQPPIATDEEIATWSVQNADALIAELNKEGGKQ